MYFEIYINANSGFLTVVATLLSVGKIEMV